jgi:hypothetical protein
MSADCATNLVRQVLDELVDVGVGLGARDERALGRGLFWRVVVVVVGAFGSGE